MFSLDDLDIAHTWQSLRFQKADHSTATILIVPAGDPIARNIISTGKRYCPHYLGGGIGLVASAHALVAVGGDGILKVDINPNPLRTELVGNMLSITPGIASLSSLPGLGFEPDLAPLKNIRCDKTAASIENSKRNC